MSKHVRLLLEIPINIQRISKESEEPFFFEVDELLFMSPMETERKAMDAVSFA